MRVIIAGSRTIREQAVVDAAVADSGFDVTEVVCGGAGGVDTLGACWATTRGIPVTMMLADWRKNGRGAGIFRNREMAGYADALVAVWDGKSRGTANMIEEMRALNRLVHVCIPGGTPCPST